MKPTKEQARVAVFKERWASYRSLCEERAKIVARLRQLDTQQIAEYIPPTFQHAAQAQPRGRLT